MPLSSSISLPISVQNQINSAASQYSVDPLVLSAIAQVMSGGQQFLPESSTLVVNSLGGVGVMGIKLSDASTLGYDASDPVQNIYAGAAYLAGLLATFTGNYPYAVAAYFSGADVVLQNNGVPPLATTQALVFNVTNLARRAGSYSMSTKNTLENQTTADPSPSGTVTGQITTPVGQSIDPNQTTLAQSLTPPFQINYGLNETPWYEQIGNGAMLTGNPRIRQNVQPVAFQVYLSRDQSLLLNNPDTGKPIVIQLNCSMTTFELQSKHVYTRTPSRTGMHITFWGMQPDLINGTCNTGVFMNQFGITDFMSVSNVTDDVKQLVQSGFERTFATNINGVQQGTSTGSVQTFSVTNSQFNNVVAKNAVNPVTAFRVAAQDAFVEFLKLFQMNGNVWFFSPNYKGSYTGQDQQALNSWSPGIGTTSFEQTARNNDVVTRGFVAMRFRQTIYLGYFKSLSWTQDADNPFRWTFNFSFQVEKTVSALYWPNFQVTQFPNVGQAIATSNSLTNPQETTSVPITGELQE